MGRQTSCPQGAVWSQGGNEMSQGDAEEFGVQVVNQTAGVNTICQLSI